MHIGISKFEVLITFNCLIGFPLSTFLFRLWVVNFIILAWFPFFAPPMGCILSTCFLKSFSSTPAYFATADIRFNVSSSFVSSSSGFRRAVTIMHDLREYEFASKQTGNVAHGADFYFSTNLDLEKLFESWYKKFQTE